MESGEKWNSPTNDERATTRALRLRSASRIISRSGVPGWIQAIQRPSSEIFGEWPSPTLRGCVPSSWATHTRVSTSPASLT